MSEVVFFEPQPVPEYRPASAEKVKRAMRYAGYVRISSEDQVGNFSVDAQRRAIESWVKAHEGILVATYVDEAQSGKSTDRPAFAKMRLDAKRHKFDALIVHKFDRFSRNRTDALAVKSLLRHDYGVRVFSVSEPSEDSDGPIGALIEGIMESVADWYSRNLATETTKGKKERTMQGLHNNQAPFGMEKIEGKLTAHEFELPGLLMAFDEYAKGSHSDNAIAKLLNDRGYRTKQGTPFSKDTVRFLLQNQTYIGKIRYQKTTYNSKGVRSRSAPTEWLDGKHEAVIPKELFEKCQEVRAKRCHHNLPTVKYNPYLLRDIVYCYDCMTHVPLEKTFRTYGKMRPQTHAKHGATYYRCLAREKGYLCKQKAVEAPSIEEQVVGIVSTLKPDPKWRDTVNHDYATSLGGKSVEDRTSELQGIIRRMDTRYDHGLVVDEQEFFTKRIELQKEMESLAPSTSDEHMEAEKLLLSFKGLWQSCKDNTEDAHELLKKVVERVYVQGKDVIAMTLKSSVHTVLGHKTKEPTSIEIDPIVWQGFCQERRRRASDTHMAILFVPPTVPLPKGTEARLVAEDATVMAEAKM